VGGADADDAIAGDNRGLRHRALDAVVGNQRVDAGLSVCHVVGDHDDRHDS
jgi:hypothetical protein